MMEQRAFDPTGKTINVDAAVAAPVGIQATGVTPTNQYRIHNAGTVTAFVAFGIDGTVAQTNAVIPTGGGANSKDSYPIPAGVVEVWSAPRDTFWSAITAAGTAEIYITPGRGL